MQRVPMAILASLVFLSACALPVSAVVVPGMTLTAAPDPVVPGGLLIYTIVATNTGDELSSPTILFNFDTNLDYLSGSPLSTQEWNGIPVTNPAFWNSVEEPMRVVQILPGGSYTITVTTRVKADVPCGTPLTSTATINDPGDGGGPSSASATVTTATTCGIPAPEFPSPVLPVAMLGLLTVGILLLRSRVKQG